MTKALITVRVGATVTHFHDPSLSERWVANLMSASTSCGAGGKRSVEDKDELGTRTLADQDKKEGANRGRKFFKKTEAGANHGRTEILQEDGRGASGSMEEGANHGRKFFKKMASPDEEASASTSARLASSLEMLLGATLRIHLALSRTSGIGCPSSSGQSACAVPN